MAGWLRITLLAALAFVGCGFALLAWRRRWGALWIGMAGLLSAAALSWSGVEPRQNRDWRAEVARTVTADFNADGTVTLHNVRDFRWKTETEAAERWESRTYDPDAITSVDMILSVWGSPLIAHTLVSFGFEDGRHIAFSGEIRKEKGESYSTLGGFFREYELALIAADERDIVHLRTDARGEEVSLYPIDMPADLRRDLFLALLRLGNDLADAPQWYNTATKNCTTVPFRLLRRLTDGAPLDAAVLFSGLLPDYTYRLGVLPDGMSLAEIERRARLGRLGPATEDGVAFSRAMRANWRG
ncbi:DUF4105 domain-containing protein [Roseovarius spongiae]|uniref:DUF4105 domain-containing protein n=2 Tax=Roseovarius spongiae TaxID=2320272 RepID=A0A3A8AZA2_9RHOB|nr:DUF4105 domain-containing protein [Roseovarius spongiae]